MTDSDPVDRAAAATFDVRWRELRAQERADQRRIQAEDAARDARLIDALRSDGPPGTV